MTTLYTIGHSTREISEFLSALRAHGIQCFFDIRAFPSSRRLPHFNRESLKRSLAGSDINYIWEPSMGGRRSGSGLESLHIALRDPVFRNYADHMLSSNFQEAATRVLEAAERMPTAYMCAERAYCQCHRLLVSDYFAIRGHEVLHIDDEEPAQSHKLTAEARIKDGMLIYSGDLLF